MSLNDEAKYFCAVDSVSELYEERIKQLTEENARLLAKAIDHETKHDVAVSTLEIVREGRLSAQKALFAQCEETKKLTTENARLRAALEDAATSLETIALRSYGDESYINTMPQVRGYAQARAGIARKELKGQP